MEAEDARENGLLSGKAAVTSTFLVLEPKRLNAETALDEARRAAKAEGASENFMVPSCQQVRTQCR